jgi:hypothetical protein
MDDGWHLFKKHSLLAGFRIRDHVRFDFSGYAAMGTFSNYFALTVNGRQISDLGGNAGPFNTVADSSNEATLAEAGLSDYDVLGLLATYTLNAHASSNQSEMPIPENL